jgi:hypothetical protein
VYKAEDFGAGTAFVEGADDVGVGDDVGSKLSRFDVEDEDEDSDGAEDVISRLVQVVLDEAILTVSSQFKLLMCVKAVVLTLRSPRD